MSPTTELWSRRLGTKRRSEMKTTKISLVGVGVGLVALALAAPARADVKPLNDKEMQAVRGGGGYGKACNTLNSATAGPCNTMPNGNSFKWIPIDYYTCGQGFPWNTCSDNTTVFDHKIFWYTGDSCGQVNGERTSESHICTNGCSGVACVPLDGSPAVH